MKLPDARSLFDQWQRWDRRVGTWIKRIGLPYCATWLLWGVLLLALWKGEAIHHLGFALWAFSGASGMGVVISWAVRKATLESWVHVEAIMRSEALVSGRQHQLRETLIHRLAMLTLIVASSVVAVIFLGFSLVAGGSELFAAWLMSNP